MKRRPIIISTAAAVVLLLVSFAMFRPIPLQGKFPNDFSETDKREIASLVRRDAYHRSFGSLTHGDFRSAWRSIVAARKQRLWAVGEQPDGTMRIHLGVEDKSEPAEYWISARYFFQKENGHWKLLQMF